MKTKFFFLMVFLVILILNSCKTGKDNPETNLSVNKTASSATPMIGTNVTFTITATNNGPSPATGVKVMDNLPAGYTFVSATPTTGTWTAPNWTIGNLAMSTSATMTMIATVNAAGSYSNTAAISGTETDPTPANNSSTNTPVPAVKESNLSVTKISSSETPLVGANITFTITATNSGPSSATVVKVTDNLPSGYTFVSATPTTGTWTAPNWTIGNLAVSASATMTLIATVNAAGSYSNTATISGTETDPTPANNSATSSPVPVVKITYNKDVKAIFVASCTPCHLAGGTNPNKWDDYTSAKNKITLILDRVNRDPIAVGFMPKNGTKLSAATIATLTKWVADGTLEN